MTFKVDQSKDPVIACMGLAFKPDIDDLRESPALHVTESLEKENFKILAVEPNLNLNKERNLETISEAIRKADIIVFLVAHSNFKDIGLDPSKKVLDFCFFFNS